MHGIPRTHGRARLTTQRPWRILAAAAVACGLIAFTPGCAALRNGAERPAYYHPEIVELPTTTFHFDQDESPYELFATYRIAPGDVLDILYQVQTWIDQDEFTLAIDHTIGVRFVELPHLDVTERVRPDGNISLPYLGEVYVVGKTVSEFADELRARYGEILRNPELYVVVPHFHAAIREFKRDLHTAPRGLSRLTTVRPDGYATFAMLGDINVAGRTIPEVAAELNERYNQILPGLGADLFLEEHAGRRIYVLGDVERPSAYRILNPTTVVEAMAMAGGFLPTSDIRQVAVIRKRGDKMIGTRLDVRDTLLLDENSEFFYLQPDDIVYVPRSRRSRWADITREVADIIFFRGWGLSASYNIRDAYRND